MSTTRNNPTKLSFTGKLNHIGNSIFSTMSAMAKETGATNLSQGFPDFEVDPTLIDLVNQKMRSGYNQYAPMAGAPELRELLCGLANDQFGADYDWRHEITITAGATQAIATAIAASIREGDEVLIFSPAYDCYGPMIELHGGTPVTVQLEYPHYRIDWQQVKRVVNHRTRMILINTPHNPSGAIWQESDFKALEEIVGNSNILILADEVYEHIVFNGEEARSVRSYPELRRRSFVIGSLGKTVHVTGWKIGYCQAPQQLMNEFQKVHQFEVFAVNHPIQLALADYLKGLNLKTIGSFYQEKQNYFQSLLLEKTGFKPLPTFGSYFQLLDYSDLSSEKDLAYAEKLTREYGVATVPTSPFYRVSTDVKVLRVCFAKNEQTLYEAAEKLAKVKPN